MAADISFESKDEEILLYFDIAGVGLNSQTFGNALLNFDELYRAIDRVANPGREIEVDFIRSDEGSIRAIFRVVSKDSKTLLHAPITLLILPFLLGVLVNRITSDSVKIVVNDGSYIVEYGNERIVLPKDGAKTAQQVERDPAVRRTVRKFFSGVESDTSINAVDFRSPTTPDQPVIPISRDQFAALRDLPELEPSELPKNRETPHYKVSVVVLTAVLERSKRKWQFLWGGQKISADIRDDGFFAKLANHEYEFGQGDTLNVDLVVLQELNEFVGAYENISFYIAKVHKHSKGPKQEKLL